MPSVPITPIWCERVAASAAHSTNEALAHRLAGRNLEIAEKKGMDLVIPCAACFQRLKAADKELKAGKKVDENGVKAVLTAAGVAADESRVKALIAALEGVSIEDAIKAAATAPVAVAAAPAAAGAAAAPAKEEKKEEHKKEDEESGMAGLGALFG